jgi:Flp pilus assembly protein TadB
MDQNREMFKLQAAAQHYESNLQMHGNYFIAFVVGVLVFSVGISASGQSPWYAGFIAWMVCLLVAALVFRKRFMEYVTEMEKLELHLRNLEKGQAAPSLKELLAE